MDPAVAGTRAGTQDHQGLWRQAVQPFAGRHGLIGVGVVPEAAPVALTLDGFVGDGAFHHQHEGVQLAPIGLKEPFEEVIGPSDGTTLEIDERPVDGDLREAG